VNWKGLKQVSATEAQGVAVMVYRFQMPDGSTSEEQVPGKFIYHKTRDGWVLDHADFPNPKNLHHQLEQDVFVKVTSAEVDTRAAEGQIPGTSVVSQPGDDRDRPLAAAETSADTDATTSAAAAPPSPAAARQAVEGYLTTTTAADGAWSAKEFRPIRRVNGNELELPATLVIQSPDGPRAYRGGFYFSYEPSAGQWLLTRMSFSAAGLEPIEESLATPVPVG